MGGPGSGRARDAALRLVAELRVGEHAVDREIDLHGLRREAARRALYQGLAAAAAAGERCVLVIHGVGNRSAEGPVLRRALPEWIESSPEAERMLTPRNSGGDPSILARPMLSFCSVLGSKPQPSPYAEYRWSSSAHVEGQLSPPFAFRTMLSRGAHWISPIAVLDG